jgi:hypothetical protein
VQANLKKTPFRHKGYRMNKENSGVVILNANQTNKPCKTVIVFGVPRGGTSMVAGTLSKLGVFMGNPEHVAPFYENMELLDALKKRDRAKLKEIISKNNSTYPMWGVKILHQALLIRWLLDRAMFSDVAYVVVFRDIFATAKRRTISMKGGLLKEMFKAVLINFGLLTLISLTKKPILLVSYEKALLFPEGFVAELATFLNLNQTANTTAAVEFIKPSPDDYRIRSTTRSKLDTDLPYFGYIDGISNDKVTGWALSLENTNPLELELLINGHRQTVITANLVREDVAQANSDFHKNCGFEFNFNSQINLKSGDCVEIRIAKPAIHLINSPYYFS